MYYFGARFYDAQVGVWLTPDPYRGEAPVPLSLHPYFDLGDNRLYHGDRANTPMSLHNYLYVQNNPANRIDVNGYATCGPYAKCVRPIFNSPVSNFFMSLIKTITGRDWKQDMTNLVSDPDTVGIELNLRALKELWSGGLKGKKLFKRDLTPATLKAIQSPVAPFSVIHEWSGDWLVSVNYDEGRDRTKLGVCLQGSYEYQLGVTFRFPNPVIKADIYGAPGLEGKGCAGMMVVKSNNSIEPFIEAEGSFYGSLNGRLYAELDAKIAGARVGIRGSIKASFKFSCSSYSNCRTGEPSLGLEVAPFYGYKYWGQDWDDTDIMKVSTSIPLAN